MRYEAVAQYKGTNTPCTEAIKVNGAHNAARNPSGDFVYSLYLITEAFMLA
jgi:hypothetical protein